MPKIHFIHLKQCSIYKQLQLEEALLRAGTENFCLINEGSPQKAVVMGISSPIEEHLYRSRILESGVDVIKRFSGGGTVVVDQDTYFVTFIFNREALDIAPFPEPILRWSEAFYQDVFHSEFALRENDYVFGEKKFGGNAKYIQKGRWLLHTSFLWDFSQENMNLLRNPKKAPEYRNKRAHQDFLTTLNQYYPNKEKLTELIIESLKKHFEIEKTFHTYPQHYLTPEHRKATQILTL